MKTRTAILWKRGTREFFRPVVAGDVRSLAVAVHMAKQVSRWLEIAIALGVIAFALIAIIGILPAGLQVQKDNREETIINQDARLLLEAIKSGGRDVTSDLGVFVVSVDGIIMTNRSTEPPHWRSDRGPYPDSQRSDHDPHHDLFMPFPAALPVVEAIWVSVIRSSTTCMNPMDTNSCRRGKLFGGAGEFARGSG